jgi:hypothetical protein
LCGDLNATVRATLKAFGLVNTFFGANDGVLTEGGGRGVGAGAWPQWGRG